MRALRGNRPREAFLTLQFHPGEAVQVDWADFGFAIPGCPRRVSAFIMALCHSRYLYIEFTLSQAMPTFLRCMERGLAFYGRTTTADIFDNMKTVVVSIGPPTIFNRRFLAYAAARGFSVCACNPGRRDEKGVWSAQSASSAAASGLAATSRACSISTPWLSPGARLRQ